MTAAQPDLVAAFEAERPRLLRLAYRLTGSFADAEDAVQESWLRLTGTDPGGLRNLAGWLTTVVSRLSLDRLTSARARRETYVGNWLPEPVVTPVGGLGAELEDPLASVIRDEDARFAAMVVLDRLTPDQRVAFVLHHGFAVPFPEVAAVLGTSAANARQLASRARRAVGEAPAPVDPEEHRAAVEGFVEALAAGNLASVVAALHPDVRSVGDSDGRTSTVVRPLDSPEKVARFFLGLVRRYGDRVRTVQPVLVNGRLGLATPGTEPRFPARVLAMEVRDGLVAATFDVANPAKFGGVRLPGWDPVVPPR